MTAHRLHSQNDKIIEIKTKLVVDRLEILEEWTDETLKQEQEGKLHGNETVLYLNYSIITQIRMWQCGAMYTHSPNVNS